jgi:Tfp pilus assembly protein PilE
MQPHMRTICWLFKQHLHNKSITNNQYGGGKMFCSKCGSDNSASAKYCRQCGSSLTEADVETSAQERQTQAYAAIIGPKNQSFYLERFSRFDDQGKTNASWHWPAFFVTFYWLLYRKMWLNALIYFFLPAVLIFPLSFMIALVGGFSEQTSALFSGIAYTLAVLGYFVLPPMYANALYYKHCKKKIDQIRAASPDYQRQLGEMSGRGGTSGIVMILVLVFGVVFLIGMLAAIALPAYQDYTTRARMASTVITAKQAADAVGHYFEQHQKIPASLDEAGFHMPASPFIKKIELDDQNAVLTITLAAAPVNDKALQMVPSLDAEKRLVWKCQSQNIPARLLPMQCR